MKLMKRRGRILVLAGYLAIGGLITQAGACWIIGANTLVGPVSANLIDTNGNLFGLFNVCGIPDTIVAGTSTTGTTTAVQNAGDDLVTFCPVQVVPAATGSGT